MKKLHKNTSLIVCFVLSAFFMMAQKPIDGFRDLKWGTDISEAESTMDLSEQEKNGKVKIYASPTDSHQIGSVTLKEIYYFFHEEAGFFKVVLSGEATENEEMDAILKNRLGRNYETIMNPSHTHRIWEVGDVMADYKQQLSEDFSLTLRSEAIADYEKAKNKVITDF